jgi:hypothetical protein
LGVIPGDATDRLANNLQVPLHCLREDPVAPVVREVLPLGGRDHENGTVLNVLQRHIKKGRSGGPRPCLLGCG